MRRTIDLGADDAFRLLSDLRTHERWIPLTTISAPRPLAEGDEVVACTARLVDDRMRVLELTPPAGDSPGVLRLAKVGPLLLGEASITVSPIGPDRSEIGWFEHVHLAGPLPRRVTSALLAPAFRLMLALAFHRIERDAAALARVRDRHA